MALLANGGTSSTATTSDASTHPEAAVTGVLTGASGAHRSSTYWKASSRGITEGNVSAPANRGQKCGCARVAARGSLRCWRRGQRVLLRRARGALDAVGRRRRGDPHAALGERGLAGRGGRARRRRALRRALVRGLARAAGAAVPRSGGSGPVDRHPRRRTLGRDQ